MNFWEIIYALIGLVIAYVHIKQHKMREPIDQADRDLSLAGGSGVEFLLALMWPVLLFAMTVNALQGRANAAGKHKAPPTSADPWVDEG